MSQDGQRSIVYQPALDGLRAVAVILVLLFHLGFGWMTGGYLGVSVFFTLSGFLITTLLVTELQRTGDLRITRFYGRRARRLLPASLICLAGACLLIAAELVPDRSGLRWYVFGGLFQFANWVPLGLQNSYAELFRALSPTDHFWSLAIEEQFYWLWPVTMLGLFRLVTRGHRSARRGRNADRADLVDANRPRPTDQIDQADDWLGRLLRALAVLFVVFAVSSPITAQLWSPDAAYFATWARVPEILAGAVLAVLVVRFELPAVTRLLAPIGLVAILALGVLTPATNGFAYEGALPLFALVSAGLIAGLQHRSMVTALLAQAPLVYLGRISYGVYLYHWPVFVVLTEARTGLGVVALSGLRLAVTFAVAVLSFHIVEQPVRERRILPRPRLGLAATGLAIPLVVLLGLTQVSNSSSFEQTSATLAPVAGTIAPLVNSSGAPSTSTPVTTSAKPPVTDPGSQTSEPDGNGPPGSAAPSEPVGSTTTAPVPASTTTVVSDLVPSRPVRMLIIGDSTALATSVGLAAWAEAEPQLAAVEVQGFGGCGVTNQGE
ncbi:MAG: acyltransferase family protein, partial [Ilumatobacteraceae bacterium]